jgi:hypothetical protein
MQMIFLPIRLDIVDRSRNKFVEIRFNFSEVLRIGFVRLAKVGLQTVGALHLRHIVRFNTERLDPERVIYDLIYCQVILYPRGILW